jgi:Cu+-exporting ATPase
MTCGACAARIERVMKRVEGVENIAVNFASHRATIDFDPAQIDKDGLVEAVKDCGFGVPEERSEPTRQVEDDWEKKAREDELSDLKRRLAVAVVFGSPVVVLGMLHLSFAGSNWIQLLLTAPVMLYSARPFFTGAWNALRHRSADMNTLVAIGTGTAFLFSLIATLAPSVVASPSGHAAHGAPSMPPVYFEAAVVIIALLMVGRMLEAGARARAGDAIRALIGLQPKSARIVRNGEEVSIFVDQVIP